MHLAEINVGKLRYPLDDPRTAGFVDNLDRVNGLAERSDGFVWRLKDDSGNATAISVYDDPLVIVNISVWQSAAALSTFAYKTIHRRFVQRRQAWFEPFPGPHLALWWVEEGAHPSALEGRLRLEHLSRVGPTAFAFTFSKLFAPRVDAKPVVDLDGDPWIAGHYRSCG